MRRMHIGLRATAFEESIEFYTALFECEPALRRDDYVKWMLDDPYVNISICRAAGDDASTGVDHIGLQLDSSDALDNARASLDGAGLARHDQDDLVCGYQRQDKSWVFDPHQLPIEVFVTHEVVDEYGTNEMPEPV